MYNRCLLIWILFCPLLVWGQAPTRKCMGHQGKVKTIISTCYKAIERNGKVVAGELTSSTRYEFNRQGCLTMDRGSLPGRENYSKTIYEYDENNIQIRIIEYRDSLVTKLSQVVRQEGNIWEWETDYKDGYIWHGLSEWNPEARIEWVTWLDEDKEVTTTARIEYDKQGNSIKMVREYEDAFFKNDTRPDNPGSDTHIYIRESIYGDKNERLQDFITEVFSDRGLLRRQAGYFKKNYLKYDERGNWTESIDYRTYHPDTIPVLNFITRHEYIYYD